MLKHHKLVVGVPVYNEARFISQSLQSLTSQTYVDFRVLIADNASSDGTMAICSEFLRRDERLHLVQHETNIGSVANFEFLLRRTESPYFMWLGGHDLVHPDYIRTQLEILDREPSISLAYSQVQWIDELGALVKVTNGGDFVIDSSDPLHRFVHAFKKGRRECTAINGMIRRDALRDAVFYPVAGIDHLLLRSIQFYGRFYRTERPLYMRREMFDWRSSYTERITGVVSSGLRRKRNLLPIVWHQIVLYIGLPDSIYRKLKYLPSFLSSFSRRGPFLPHKLPKRLRRAVVSVVRHLRGKALLV